MEQPNEHIHTDFQEGPGQKERNPNSFFWKTAEPNCNWARGTIIAVYICKAVCLTLQSPAIKDSRSFCESLKINDPSGHLKQKSLSFSGLSDALVGEEQKAENEPPHSQMSLSISSTQDLHFSI